nr:aldolase/citrate lyase family protein [Fodinicola feengrottensis]
MRSLFFVPGGRAADMIAKVPRFAPDVAVVDLEDAVPVADKESARAVAVQALSTLDTSVPMLVRVNATDTPWFLDDVAAVAPLGLAGLVLPKLERPADLEMLRSALSSAGWEPSVVVAGLETALGVADARVLIAPPVTAVFFLVPRTIRSIWLGGVRLAGWRSCTPAARLCWPLGSPGCRLLIRLSRPYVTRMPSWLTLRWGGISGMRGNCVSIQARFLSPILFLRLLRRMLRMLALSWRRIGLLRLVAPVPLLLTAR